MKVHEYQARELLSGAGIPVPPGAVVQSVEEAEAHAKRLLSGGASIVVVKAQVHAGGRGKAGGVKLCASDREIEEAASAMLGAKLVTHQTRHYQSDYVRL